MRLLIHNKKNPRKENINTTDTAENMFSIFVKVPLKEAFSTSFILFNKKQSTNGKIDMIPICSNSFPFAR